MEENSREVVCYGEDIVFNMIKEVSKTALSVVSMIENERAKQISGEKKEFEKYMAIEGLRKFQSRVGEFLVGVEQDYEILIRNIRKTSFSGNTKNYTFENFIVNKGNDFAHAVAEAVSKSPGSRYNPFFMYGDSELEKTHLLYSIGNKLLDSEKTRKICFCTANEFIEDMNVFGKKNKVKEFEEKYKNIDILLIEDIQNIIRNKQAQKKFAGILKYLYEEKKQIVITGNSKPDEMVGLSKILLASFELGLIVDVFRNKNEDTTLNKEIELINTEVEDIND